MIICPWVLPSLGDSERQQKCIFGMVACRLAAEDAHRVCYGCLRPGLAVLRLMQTAPQ